MDVYVHVSEYVFGCVCGIVYRMDMLHVLQQILNVYLRVYTHVYDYVCMYVCMYDVMHVYQFVCAYVCVCACVYVYVYVYVYFVCALRIYILVSKVKGLYSAKESKEEIPINNLCMSM